MINSSIAIWPRSPPSPYATAARHCRALAAELDRHLVRQNINTGGQAVDVKQVGRELGVRYVLEGSVRKEGGPVRIARQPPAMPS